MILDTNALSAYLDNAQAAVNVISEATEIAIPIIVVGEFLFGIMQSRYRDAYARSLQRMMERSTILDIDVGTARHYAAIRVELKSAGRPIPANDVWIAALSRRHSMPVMTRDTHFDFVAGLERRSW